MSLATPHTFGRFEKQMLAFAVLLLLLLGGQAAQGQAVSTYVFATNTGATLDPMTGATTAIGSGSGYNAAASAAATIGFTFPFAGSSYTQFWVNAAGELRLGNASPGTDITFPLAGNTPGLAPLSGPYTTSSDGSVRYRVVGSSPNRRLVVEWFVGQSGSGASKQFQAWLTETSGVVQFVYAGGYTHNSTGAIGIATSASAYQCVDPATNASTSSTVPPVSGQVIAAGTYYRFSPPAPVGPAVTSVSAPANGTYGPGQSLNFGVVFNQAVTVNTAGGTPTIALTVGGTTRAATYVSGSGGSTLVFRYSVVSGDLDTDGVTLGGSLVLNGGTIRNGAATNAALTLNGVASTAGVLVDGVAPTATLASTAGGATRISPIPVTLTFSGTVTGFALSDLTITNGTASGLTGSGANYSFNVTPAANGTVTVALPANAALDAGSNGNTASNTLSRIYDTQAPTATVSSAAGSSTSTSPIPVTVTFSQAVTGFALADVTVTNGTASGLSGSGTTYTFSVTPAASGLVTVAVVANAAQDAATNNSTASNTFSISYAPPASVSSITIIGSSPTNAATASFTVTFSASVTGGGAGNFTLTATGITGASVTGVSGTGNTRTVTVNTGSGDGTLRLNMSTAAGVVPTLSNVPYTTGAVLTVNKTAPTVALSSTATASTRTSPIPVVATFSEAVTGFTLTDVTVTNGTASGLTGSGASYSFSVTPAANGAVTIAVGANTAQDAAGNPNPASNTLTRIFDNVAPTATLASTAGSATRISPIPVTLTFSEGVTGFALTDLTVTNGTASGLSGSSASYSFSITPSGSGNPPSTVTVALPASTAQDAAGNTSAASNTLSIIYDTQAPTVVISSTAPDPTNTSPIPVTVVFSQAVTGFTLTDVTVTNGTPGSLSGSGTTYTFSISPAANGVVTVAVAANAAQDAAANGNTASNTLSRTYDNQGPTLTLTSTAPANTNTSPIPVTVVFSQAVTGFSIADVTVTNGTKGGFSGSGASYSFTITPTANGTVTAVVAAGVAVDGASNPNVASNTLSRTYDTTAPTVSLSTTAAARTNTAAFPVAVVFSESVTGFTLTDVTVTNGTASGLSGSGANYSFTVTASGTGNPASAVSVQVGAATVQDAATNANTASNVLAHTFDTQAPTATLASTANPTPTSPIPVTVTFSEAVTGFTLGDVVVTNGAPSALSGSGSSYAFSVTPAASGLVTVNLAANAALDAAGNGNTAAAPLSRTYQPAVSVSSITVSPALTNDASVTFTVATSGSVTGWSTSNFTLTASGVTGATIQSATGSGATCTVVVLTGSGDGTLRLNVATDAGLTPALTNDPFNTGMLLTLDRTAPTITGVSDGLDYSTNRVISFADAHSPSATLNGTPFASGSTVSADGSYSLEVTDGAGNVTTVSFTLDKTPPSTVITAGPGALTNDNTPFFSFDSPDGGVSYATTGGPGLTFPSNGPNATFGPLADGTYTLSVAAVDAAGNTDPSPATYTFTIDTQAPNTSITAQPTDPSTATTAHFEFTATESATFLASLDGAAYAAVNPANTNYSGLALGSHTLSVYATDGAGNADPSPATYTWEVVPPAPTVTAISPAAELPGQSVTITGTNFTSGSSVSFGGVAASSVSFLSPTSLLAVVPAGALVGSSAVLVTTGSGSNASAPAFAVLGVYASGSLDACIAVPASATTGDGQWHYLLSSGQVVLAYNYTGASLGSFGAEVWRANPASPVRQDVAGHPYLDRNFHLTASGGSFTGRTVQLRFYGLTSELARLVAADPAVSYNTLSAIQYSGPNEDCDLSNDNFTTGERRVLSLAAGSPDEGLPWFVAQATVTDHFSEFFLTGPAGAQPLPVELVAFTAAAKGPNVQLSWRTASEKNSARFEVQRSGDGQQFERIGTVAAQGTTSSPTDYTYWDDKRFTSPIPQLTYYRLRQVDLDGSASYSPVRAVTVGGKELLVLYPNPAHAAVAVAGLAAGAKVDVLDAVGRVVAQATADATGTAALTLPRGLAAGIYVVRGGGQTQRLAVE